MSQEIPAIRLTIWRPVRTNRRLVAQLGGGPAKALTDETLQEEAYRWEVIEDIQGSLHPDFVDSYRATVFEAFAPNLPPSDRSITKLAPAIQALEEAIAASTDIGWKQAFATVRDGDDARYMRAHPALGLLLHLRWISDVFRDVPRASVTVR